MSMFARFHWAIRALPRGSVVLRIGQVLAIAGVLVLLFVGYRQWGTAIETAQAQSAMAERFDEIVDRYERRPEPGRNVRDERPTATTATANEPAATIDIDETVEQLDPVLVRGGDLVARIEAPSIDLSYYVVAGVSVGDLKHGPGHYPTTPQPGHLGNVAIAGHRTTYGEPFRNLDELDVGDAIVLHDLRGRTFSYRVTDSFVVDPSDTWVVETANPDRATLTLTTCHPEFSNAQRLVVTADLDVMANDPIDDPAFWYADGIPVPQPSPSTVAVADDVVESTTAPTQAATGQADTPPGAPAPRPVTSSSSATTDTAGVAATAIVFDEGWFDDPRALPHTAGWCTALVLLIVGWRRLRYGRGGIVLATAVVVAPTAVALYFTFQNLNRLLPSYL